VPAVVLEIVAGVVVGPSVLGVVEEDQAIAVLALLGPAFLFFLAGLEIDLRRLRGRRLAVGQAGFAVSLAAGRAARCCAPSPCPPPAPASWCRCSRTRVGSAATPGRPW
jgi:Kef-type K+ transport system membrane component KefB